MWCLDGVLIDCRTELEPRFWERDITSSLHPRPHRGRFNLSMRIAPVGEHRQSARHETYGKILIHCFFDCILLVSSSEAKLFFFVHEENIAHNFLCGQDTLLLTGLKKKKTTCFPLD